MISTAGNATLSVADPSSNNTGKLVNGTFALPQGSGRGHEPGRDRPGLAAVGGSASPTRC